MITEQMPPHIVSAHQPYRWTRLNDDL